MSYEGGGIEQKGTKETKGDGVGVTWDEMDWCGTR